MSKFLFKLLFVCASLGSTTTYGEGTCRDSLNGVQIKLPHWLKIVKTPNSSLNQPCPPVPPSLITSPLFEAFIENMIQFRKTSGGVGLAAPQVGVPLRVAVVRPPPSLKADKKAPFNSELILINPTVTPLSSKMAVGTEGCLSISSACQFVSRYQDIRVDYTDINGTAQSQEFSDFTSIIIQHETDHLDGILFTDISQRQLKKFGIKAAGTIDTLNRSYLLKYLKSLSKDERKLADPLILKLNRDLSRLQDDGSTLGGLRQYYEQKGLTTFIDDLLEYHLAKLQRRLTLPLLQHWTQSVFHALFVIEDLYLTPTSESKVLLSKAREENKYLRDIVLNGIRGPPFEDIRQVEVPKARSSSLKTVTAQTVEEVLTFSRAIGDFSIVWKNQGFELRIREGDKIHILNTGSIAEINQLNRAYQIKQNQRPATALIKLPNSKHYLQGDPSRPLSYGLEAEYTTSLDSAILNDYRTNDFTEEEWIQLDLPKRLSLFEAKIAVLKKKATFFKLSTAPEWLPLQLYGESNRNFEFNGMVFETLDEAKNFLLNLEHRYGKGYYQGHVVFANGSNVKGISGFALFEADLAQLETLEVNFDKSNLNPHFVLAKNLLHHSLGPLGETDRKALLKAETAIAKNNSINMARTKKTLAPIPRTLSYPNGMAGIEFRQFGNRSIALLRAMWEASSELQLSGNFFGFDKFKNIPVIDETASFKQLKSISPSLSKRHYQGFLKKLTQVTEKMYSDANYKIRMGGELAPGSRFLYPLRDWIHHPVLAIVPLELLPQVAEQLKIATQVYAEGLIELINNNSLAPEEASDRLRPLIVKWGKDASLSRWFRAYKDSALFNPNGDLFEQLLARSQSSSFEAESLAEWPDLPFVPLPPANDSEPPLYKIGRNKAYFKNENYKAFMYNSVEIIYDDVSPYGHIRLRIGDRLFAFDYVEKTVRDIFEGLGAKANRVGFAFQVPYSEIKKQLPDIDRFYNNAVTYNMSGFDAQSVPLFLKPQESSNTYEGLSQESTHFFFANDRLAKAYIVDRDGQTYVETPDGVQIKTENTDKGFCIQSFSCSTSATFVLNHFFGKQFGMKHGAQSLMKSLKSGASAEKPDAIIFYR